MPLIKLKINKVEIDLLLCSKKSCAKDLAGSSFTANKKSLNSILGHECSTILEKAALSLLPKRQGLQVFQEVTKLVKMFCKRKGIYGHNLCYLNGMSIQVLVLRAMELIYLPQRRSANLADIDKIKSLPMHLQVEHVFEQWFNVHSVSLERCWTALEPIQTLCTKQFAIKIEDHQSGFQDELFVWD